ncbi:MAG: hypothetical protein ACYTFX_12700 [Planctomycetota bacterium]
MSKLLTQARTADAKKALHDMIRKHPLFGKPRKRAPCSHAHLAKLLGVGEGAIKRRRAMAGVWAYRPPNQRKQPPKPPKLTPVEERAYALCKLVAAWKRPKGMEAHLKSKPLLNLCPIALLPWILMIPGLFVWWFICLFAAGSILDALASD